MKGLLQQFLSAAADALEHLDAELLEWEREPHAGDTLDEVFRAVHTLKDCSGLFDLPQLTRLAHAAEDLLAGVRAGRIDLDAAAVGDLLATVDLIRTWLAEVERTGALPPEASADGAALGARLRAPLGSEPAPPPVPGQRTGSEPGSGGRPASPAAGWLLEELGTDRVERLRGWLDRARTACRVLRFEPSERCFFNGEDPLHLVTRIPAVEDVAIAPREPWPAPVDFDEYRCLLVFTVVTRATIAELEHLFRYVPDQVVVAEVDAAGLARLLAGVGSTPGGVPLETARQVLSSQLAVLRVDIPADQAQSRIRSAGAAARTALSVLGRPAATLAELDAAQACALGGGGARPLADLLERELSCSGELPGPGGPPAPDADVAEPAGSGAAPSSPPIERRTALVDRRAGSSRVLKVDQVAVDRLLDLVNELVVAKNGLPLLAAAAERESNARDLARQIKDRAGVINRITEELRSAVMDVRMLPVRVAFARFPRMVRDLARDLGKQVLLAQEGSDTAADKDVIEMLGDPLVHLVRNCLDHGIEPPDERVATGKPAQATIRLRAGQEPDALVVDVIDDGRGIDPATIAARACALGLITEQQRAGLSDAEALDLVFLPGFSTATGVSDLSGRGVGMDAVRAGVESVGGSVLLTSTPGEGSRVRLRVPLSMAVSHVMVVTAGGQRFGIPIELVRETVRVPSEHVGRVEHHAVIVLRDELVPVVDLAAALQIPPMCADPTFTSILVTRCGGDDVGLIVEAFHPGAEVIVRPMEGVLAGSNPYRGTAVMGDGSVLLVLDLLEVLARAGDAV